MSNFNVVFVGVLIDGQKALIRIEIEMAFVVVGKIVCLVVVADDKNLHEAQQRVRVAVARIVFIVDNLLHRTARAHIEGFKLDLNDWEPVDQQNHIVAVMGVVGVDTELIDHFKLVFAPVFEIDERVIQWRAVVAFETVDLA